VRQAYSAIVRAASPFDGATGRLASFGKSPSPGQPFPAPPVHGVPIHPVEPDLAVRLEPLWRHPFGL